MLEIEKFITQGKKRTDRIRFLSIWDFGKKNLFIFIKKMYSRTLNTIELSNVEMGSIGKIGNMGLWTMMRLLTLIVVL